jgi:hypothetical protein
MPALTRFRASLPDLGRKLGEDLVEVIEAKAAGHQPPARQTIWPMELVPGESDGPPRFAAAPRKRAPRAEAQ